MSGVATNVTAGKPRTSGAVFTAPVGTTLPTDAVTALSGSYIDLGYLSEDGVTKNISITTTNIKEWGGAIVLITQDDKTATFKFKMIEYLNANVQKFVNGDNNVTGTLSSGMAVTVDDAESPERVLVFWQIMRGNVPHRMVIPRCRISEIGEVVFRTNDAVGYDVTVTAIKDDDGKYFKEYFGGTSGT